MITWPQDLVDDIARRRCVLFLGSGVSKNSTNSAGLRPKDWLEFLSGACQGQEHEAVIKKLIKASDYLTACEIIKSDLGREDFTSLLRKEFLTPRFRPAEIHEHIYNLDSRVVATPNFDKIYDVYAEKASEGSVLVKCYDEEDLVDCIRRNEPIILKIHGTIAQPHKLIFSRKDYSLARNTNRTFYSILDALIITHTFIFIGCGINDPDIRLLLEDYTFSNMYSRRHYIIMPKKSVAKPVLTILENTMSLKAIEYDPKDHHTELTASIANLVVKVEGKRRELADTMEW